MPSEPHATVVALLAAGAILVLSVIASPFARRAGIPVVLLFLVVGMLAGSEGIGRIAFANYALSYRVGTLALVLILFDGGLRTPVEVVRRALAPAVVLATAGVALTAAIVAAGARSLGFSWTQGLLLGSIVSSTDAATVFSVLRGGGVHLQERVESIVELESGLNDPVAVILTLAFTASLVEGEPLRAPLLLLHVAEQLAVGAAVGAALGFGARFLLPHVRLGAGGLYPVLTMGLALVAFSIASLLAGSGFLAVYIAGFLVGSGHPPNRSALLRVHDFVAWCSQIGMFLVLGLLVSPSRLVSVAGEGITLSLLLAFVARPGAVAVCLFPFRLRAREILLVGWAGLRGAVPIILALIPVLARVEGAEVIFDVVFFVVVVSVVLQGGTVRWVTRLLRLGTPEPAVPTALLEIESTRPLDVDLITFYISPVSAVCGARIADIPFPERSSAMLVVRDEGLIAPKGETVLHEGDHVFVFCPREDVPLVRLLFGREAE
jgi:cell volume regulation protein A